jgi:hypothetical protein
MSLNNMQLSQSSPLGERKGGTFKNYLESQGKSKSTVEHYYKYLIDFILTDLKNLVNIRV